LYWWYFDAVNGVSHTLVDCDDNNACTVDYCDVESGCESYDLNCDDSNACTTDRCNPDTWCQYENLPIDDNNSCTYDYCCPINLGVGISVCCTPSPSNSGFTSVAWTAMMIMPVLPISAIVMMDVKHWFPAMIMMNVLMIHAMNKFAVKIPL